jgi:hypothetical protein
MCTIREPNIPLIMEVYITYPYCPDVYHQGAKHSIENGSLHCLSIFPILSDQKCCHGYYKTILSYLTHNVLLISSNIYLKETRCSIRLLLLQSFGALCNLEVRVISELLTSVLPLELARDLQTDLSSKDLDNLYSF